MYTNIERKKAKVISIVVNDNKIDGEEYKMFKSF